MLDVLEQTTISQFTEARPHLSILIVSYNTREPLRRCLLSIQEHQADLNVETIIVDNGSRDGSVDMIREQMPTALVIEPGCNTWFTGGMNLGLKVAKGNYALILNPDTVVQAGALQTLVSYLCAHPQVGAATCQLRQLDSQLQLTCSQIPRYTDFLLEYTPLRLILSFWRKRRHARMWYQCWDRQTTRAVGVIPDSCLCAPVSLLRKLDGYDERFKLYFTEDDLCKRIQDTGFECHFVADVVILHQEHASTNQVQRLATQIYFRDLLVFSGKYYGQWLTLLLKIMVFPLREAMDIAQRIRDRRKAQKIGQ